MPPAIPTHVYEVRPRRDHDAVDLISYVLPQGRRTFSGPGAVTQAINYAKFYSRAYRTAIGVYNAAGDVIETHGHNAAND